MPYLIASPCKQLGNSPLLSDGVDQFPDSREMMIVVLRDKVQMIHETHGLLQSRMQLGTCKESWLKFPYVIHQTSSRRAELNQNLHQIPAVVFCFMSFAIAKVCGGERVSIREKVIHSRQPQ
jgi:hypothetical protein